MKGSDILSKYYSIHEFSKIIGASSQTLRNWDANGKLHLHHTTVSGYRYYSDEQLNQVMNVKPKNRITIGYCRVSSHKQKDDLERQIDNVRTYLMAKGQPFEITSDIGSGINYKKKGLQELIKRISQNQVEKVVVLYKDRLLKFGFELVEYIASLYNCEIEIIDNTEKSEQQELVEDLVQIIKVFSCKLQGRRANKAKKLNWVRLAEHGRIPTDAKYMNPRISFDGLNWWISVCVDFPDCKEELNDDGVGIDLGIKDLAICSDKNTYKNINKSQTVKKLEKRKRKLQRSVSRKYEQNKEKGKYCKTHNVIKKKKLLLKVDHRLTNIRKNYLNQTTSEIVNRKPRFICIEDLNVSGMMKNRHLSKAVQNQGFFEFRKQLEYKCNVSGIKLIIADRFYPSSKLCSCCGKIKKDLKLSDRTYRCECGNIIDRDFQAALNLRAYGEQFAS